jgi:hypothetical protein
MTTKYAKWPLNISKGRKIPTYIGHGHKIYQDFPLQDPPKITNIGIFGMKINHLATLFKSLSAKRPTHERNDFLHHFFHLNLNFQLMHGLFNF